tara:strand:+ start:233 stop:454 length:222 start_codon:yes stop_codon:yes gene_type:complete
MVPGKKIVRQKSFVTYQPNVKEEKGGIYFITLILRDDKGHDFVFRSRALYQHDESGKAHFDLSTVRTADFKNT